MIPPKGGSLVDGVTGESARSGVQAGLSANCPLTLQGQCNGHPVVILIDSCATHDFVAQTFVSKQVPSQAKSCIRHTVQWADGRACTNDQRLQALISIGAYQEQRPLLVCTLEGYDVILGKPWVTDHNPLIDWRCHTLQVCVFAPKVEVKGHHLKVEVKGPPLPILLKDKVLSMSGSAAVSEVNGLLAVEGEMAAQGRKDPPEKRRTALVESLL